MASINILKSFETEPKPFDFVLPGMLASTVGFILSPGGTGKSMLALEAAVAVAGGIPEADLLGLSPKGGKVFYFAAEDPPIAFEHRLYAMGKYLAPEARSAIAENLKIESLVGRMPDIMNPLWFEAIIKACDGYRLIIIDTLSRFHALDENSNGDMSRLISRLEYITQKTGSAILVIHHSSKGMAVAGRGDEQQAGRGASALIDNARWAANLIGMSKDECMKLASAPGGPLVGADERGYFVRFAVSKQNHGKPFEERWFVRGDGGILVPTTLYPFIKIKKGNNEL